MMKELRAETYAGIPKPQVACTGRTEEPSQGQALGWRDQSVAAGHLASAEVIVSIAGPGTPDHDETTAKPKAIGSSTA